MAGHDCAIPLAMVLLLCVVTTWMSRTGLLGSNVASNGDSVSMGQVIIEQPSVPVSIGNCSITAIINNITTSTTQTNTTIVHTDGLDVDSTEEVATSTRNSGLLVCTLPDIESVQAQLNDGTFHSILIKAYVAKSRAAIDMEEHYKVLTIFMTWALSIFFIIAVLTGFISVLIWFCCPGPCCIPSSRRHR